MNHLRIAFPLLMTSWLLSACTGNDARIVIEDAWARPAGLGENSAVYFRITSSGGEDILISVNTELAKETELHRSMMGDDGTMKMERQDQIALPANRPVNFRPGGLHVMLMGLKEELRPGEQLTLRLVFANQEEMIINVPVQKP